MSNHVYARISGYNLTIVPLAPFSYRQSAADGRTLALSHSGASGTRRASLTITDTGYAVELGAGTSALDELADVQPGAVPGAWVIETSLYVCPWPYGFDLSSAPEPGGPSVFDLIAPSDALIYVQGPFASERLPELEAMAAPGQQITSITRSGGQSWVELAYAHAGQAWLQRHYMVPFHATQALIVTLQAPREAAAAGIAAAGMIAQHLKPYLAPA